MAEKQRRSLIIWLSGADPDTLARSPREIRKFSGLGGVVLTTAAMAALSAGFALYVGMRSPLLVAIVVGLLWGLAIANLDRWLVAAASRRERWYQNLAVVLPRLALALVIGTVVSTPLVLWIFNREIEAELNIVQQEKRNAHQQALLSDSRFSVIPTLEAKVAELGPLAAGTATPATVSNPTIVQLQKEYDDLDKQYSAARDQATCEFDGTCGTKTRGDGEAYREKMRVAEELKGRRDEVKKRLDAARDAAAKDQQSADAKTRAEAAAELKTTQAELERLKLLKQQEEDRYLADSRNDRGLLARLEALSHLTDSNATLKTAYLVLLVFITAIEVLPVLTKFLLNIGPATVYDRILASAESSDVDKAQTALEFERARARRELEARAERQEEMVKQVAERAVKAEEDIRNREIDQWRTNALREVDGVAAVPASAKGGLPKARRGQRNQTGYTPWPEDERRANGGAAASEEPGDDGTTTTRWQFK